METLHFMGLSMLIVTVGLFDLRMLGLANGFTMCAVHIVVPWGFAGYALIVLYTQQAQWEQARPHARRLVELTRGESQAVALMERVEREAAIESNP